MTKCKNKIPDYFSVGLNGLFHVLILFTFLTILFFTLVSSLETNAFNNEIQDQIDDSMKEMVEKISPENKIIIDEIVNIDVGNGQSPIDIAIERYSKPSEVIQESNNWVKLTSVSIILVLALIIVVIISVLYLICNKCTGVLGILKENIITFMFVGLVEYLFFTQISFKYIPAPPSTMVSTLVNAFKETFAGV